MIDYKRLGFKAGLEIHQQLDTPKLFSGAPSYLRSDAPHFTVKRKLHAVAGESGEIDTAAAHEAAQNKEFHYEGYHDTTTLVDLDEEPPRPINEEALDVALQMALLLKCQIYPVTQIMRKTVIDGSNTSGFQRTVLLAHDGILETTLGNIRIDSICLEEDSARIVSRDRGKALYRLDRLGIPLVEIATAPDMYTPEHVKEAALKLGEILRACKVKRGIGTIRQDVNVSIAGHEKVEIKGFQEPSMFVRTIEKEIERQQMDLHNGKEEGSVRNALETGESEFLRPLPGKARMYPETDLPLLKIPLQRINALKKNLPKLRHDIKADLKKKGLSEDLIILVLDGYVNEFSTLFQILPLEGPLIAKMITLWRQEIATKSKKSIEELSNTVLTERALEQILELVKKKKIESGDVKLVMAKLAEGISLEEASKIERVDGNALEAEVRAIIQEKPGLRANAYMGMVMAKLKGKVDAKKAMELISKSIPN